MTANTKKTRLLQKASTTYLLISIVLMLVSTVALYFYVKNLLQSEIEEELRSTEARVESSISEHKPLYQLPPMVEIELVPEMGLERLKDTVIYDPSQNEMEEFRELSTYFSIEGKNYHIITRALIVESENILLAIVISFSIIIAMVFLFLFYLNNNINKKLWNPFFLNLEAMKNFSITSEKPIQLVQSDILEFSELNTEIETLTDKVRTDYKNLKQYTEDVSHELQTPLAIMQARIENIINGEDLKDVQYEQLTSIQKDIHRLTQMNKRLTLLTKIENQQFTNPELVDLKQTIEKRSEYFNDLFPDKIKFGNTDTLNVRMDNYLADVLCDNLISNALKHSLLSKTIEISIADKILTVSNEGETMLQHPEKLFARFYRESSNTKSTGLGLAIVQKICDLYGYKPSYSFIEDSHVFKVDFN